MSFDIEYVSQFNSVGSRMDLQAKLGTTNDFHNTYTYDNLQRLTTLTQAGVSGGNAVAGKTVDFAYNAKSQFTKISRYADSTGTEFVANTFYAYDNIGRLTSLIHTMDSSAPTSGWGSGILAGYHYAFDAASRITSVDSYLDSLSDYGHDNTGQLIAADHSSQTDESYSYDENGNRTTSGSSVGDNNHLTSDGTYNYTYDAEGNRLTKTNIATGEKEEHTWDHRNRLIAITFKDSSGNVIKTVEQSYDIFNRWVRRSVDPDGAGSAAAVDTFFSHEQGQIALQFAGSTASDLSHRYLYGPAVDQLMADESVTSLSSAGNVIWPLADHQGTTRDLAQHNPTTHATTVANHRFFDSFGNLVSQTNSSLEILIGFTGRPIDDSTGLQNNLNRWYAASNGIWISEDPIGFQAGDTNLVRYVSNFAMDATDPSGLCPLLAGLFIGAAVAVLVLWPATNANAPEIGGATYDPMDYRWSENIFGVLVGVSIAALGPVVAGMFGGAAEASGTGGLTAGQMEINALHQELVQIQAQIGSHARTIDMIKSVGGPTWWENPVLVQMVEAQQARVVGLETQQLIINTTIELLLPGF